MWKNQVRKLQCEYILLGSTRYIKNVHPSVAGALLGEEIFDPWNTNYIASEQGHANSHAWNDQTLNLSPVATELSRSGRSPISEELLEALRRADRKGRDVVVGLSNACCKWGCSKSEISSLC